MTEIIGDHGLFCIDDHDYAAFALAMQCNAQVTDEALSSVNNELTGYRNRPWVSVSTTTTATISSSGGTIGPGGIVGESIETTGSGTGSPLVVRNQWPVSPDNIPPGVYLVGSSINWTFGATTAGSNRQLLVFAVPRIGVSASFSNAVQLFRMRDYQGDGGATGALTSVGIMDARAGNMSSFAAFISHTNAASDMSVAPGNWRLWATYLGSGVTF